MKRLLARMGTWVATVPALRLLQTSAVLTIVALALMVWSMVQSTPLPVMLAMTAGQAIGTLAFALYIAVVARDLRQLRRARREATAEPEPASDARSEEPKP